MSKLWNKVEKAVFGSTAEERAREAAQQAERTASAVSRLVNARVEQRLARLAAGLEEDAAAERRMVPVAMLPVGARYREYPGDSVVYQVAEHLPDENRVRVEVFIGPADGPAAQGTTTTLSKWTHVLPLEEGEGDGD